MPIPVEPATDPALDEFDLALEGVSWGLAARRLEFPPAPLNDTDRLQEDAAHVEHVGGRRHRGHRGGRLSPLAGPVRPDPEALAAVAVFVSGHPTGRYGGS